MKNIILIGPPGSGKGTQSKLISSKLGLIHISTGDLIREEQAKDSKIGKLATNLIDKGNYLPDEIVISMVKQKIIDNPNVPGFIFDGFPRTVEQAKALDSFLNIRKTPINKIFFMELTDVAIKNRISERCEKENRADDKPEVIQTRITTYKSQTIPVIDYYNNGFLFSAKREVVNIQAAKTREEIFSELESII